MSMSTNTTKIDVKPNRRPGGVSDFWMDDILQGAIMGPEQDAEQEQQPSPDIVSGQHQVGVSV
jgi:hypothetical protein